MEVRHANFCKNILYEIRRSAPLVNLRTKWNELQSRCVSQTISVTEKREEQDSCLQKLSSWREDCECYESNPNLILTTNKMSVEITHEADKETITNYIQSGIFNFGIDLFFGSVQQNLECLVRLQEAALAESTNLGFSIPMSIYLKLSPRLQYTGGLKKNRHCMKLKLDNRVILTTNRKYASCGCHSFIYVNAKFLIFDIKRCDIICLGDTVQVQVIEVQDDNIICKVIAPGIVTARTRVIFPSDFGWALTTVSAEELEDMTFAIGTNIPVIVSYAPGCPDFFEQLHNTLFELKCENYYMFTRVTLRHLNKEEDAEWIASSYDGFILDCSEEKPKDRIVKLSPSVRKFFLKVYHKRKPIFLYGCWSPLVDNSDYLFAFYYPDKYVLPCSADFLHLFEAVFSKLAPIRCTDKNFKDDSLTGSKTMARSIVAASYDFQADAIIMCTVVAEMVAKIAHFRPKAPIVAVTSLASCANYASMHHNIWMLVFEASKDTNLSHKKETHQKLVYGVRYAVLKNLIDSNSIVILVYRRLLRYGFTDKFVVVKFDENYVETIKKVILQK